MPSDAERERLFPTTAFASDAPLADEDLSLPFSYADIAPPPDGAGSAPARRAGSGAAHPLAALLAPGGAGLERAGTSHAYTPREQRRLAAVESIDYLAPSSRVYRAWLAAQPYRRRWDAWLMMAAIGAAVGSVGFALHAAIHVLAFAKYRGARWLLAHAHWVVGWAFNMAVSLGLVYASTWLVVNVAPEAAGAGVAEVTAYLNGCAVPRVFGLRTLAVKFLSAAAAVGSGLPAGPEGPMIHLGAGIGAGLSQGHSTALGTDWGGARRFRNPKDKRDFVTAGAAVGVAVAFSAPIGGLLFVWEEVASFWQHSLGWQIFFACMVAVLTSDTLRSALSAFREGSFGLFDKGASTVVFEVQTQLANHVMATIPAAVCGVLAGLAAIAFIGINLRAARARAALLRTKAQRMAEPLVLIAVFVTLSTVLPLFFPCTPTQCVVIQGESTPVCPEGTPPRIQRIVEDTLELYTCSPAAATSDIPPDWDGADPGRANITVPKAYNELATLMSVTGEDAIRHLFSRGTHREFGYAALLTMLAVYFVGAAVTAGSAIASGVFVPMLLIGACIGRLVGLATVDMAAARGAGSAGAPPGVFLPPSPWAWIDPGAFALVGAGAFMGGVTRMTLALAVIVMEMSNDVRILLPAMTAITLAKWVADAGSRSLYHSLLELKCVPFLPKEALPGAALELLEVRHVMAAPVVTLRERVTLGELRDVLRSTRHHGFPVVREAGGGGSRTASGKGGGGGGNGEFGADDYGGDFSGGGGGGANGGGATASSSSGGGDWVFVGTVAREHLLRLLLEAVRRGTAAHLALEYGELQRGGTADPGAAPAEEAQQLAVLQGRPPTPGHFPAPPGLWAETLDLSPYVNLSAHAVPEAFSVARAYVLFSTMGLRHLVVVDARNRVRGVITRKDLLGFRLEEAVARGAGGVGRGAPA